MEEISEEQQAAMALKLMDNVKELIIDTVATDIMNTGLVRSAIASVVQQSLLDTSGGSTMQMSVKRIVMEQMGKY
jgi:hypothetical protein